MKIKRANRQQLNVPGEVNEMIPIKQIKLVMPGWLNRLACRIQKRSSQVNGEPDCGADRPFWSRLGLSLTHDGSHLALRRCEGNAGVAGASHGACALIVGAVIRVGNDHIHNATLKVERNNHNENQKQDGENSTGTNEQRNAEMSEINQTRKIGDAELRERPLKTGRQTVDKMPRNQNAETHGKIHGGEKEAENRKVPEMLDIEGQRNLRREIDAQPPGEANFSRWCGLGRDHDDFGLALRRGEGNAAEAIDSRATGDRLLFVPRRDEPGQQVARATEGRDALRAGGELRMGREGTRVPTGK